MGTKRRPGLTTPGPTQKQSVATDIWHLTGCPRGCGAFHELPCLVGEPIDGNVDYSLSAVWVGNPPKLSDLRTLAVAA